jgi:sporulation protein YlmC with PRC-barrel domain
MTRTHRSLFGGAALALVLPSLAMAQAAATEDAGPAVDPSQATQSTTATTDSAAATTDAGSTMEQGGSDVQVTSAGEPMSLDDWTYDELYANGISIGQILNADVYDPNGEDIGDVDNVLFNMEGEVQSIVAQVGGGFLNIGSTHVNIPWDMVSTENWIDGLVIPFGAEEVESYALVSGGTDGEVVGSEEVAELEGGLFQDYETGPNIWRATELLNNAARLREGEAFANYGLVSDMVVQDGRIAAVLVTPDAGFGAAGGLYGYPYAGTQGWTRGGMDGTTGVAADGTTATTEAAAPTSTMGTTGIYDLPYDRAQVERLEPFDPAMLAD